MKLSNEQQSRIQQLKYQLSMCRNRTRQAELHKEISDVLMNQASRKVTV